MRSLRRNKKGSPIAELGPALFILIIVIMIPLMVLIYVGLGFACGWYLNFMSVRAAAVVPAGQMATALSNMEASWYQSGLPAFTGATVGSNTAQRFDKYPNILPDGRDVPKDDLVVVTTIVTIRPFVSIPFVPMQTMTFTYRGERPIEEAGSGGTPQA